MHATPEQQSTKLRCSFIPCRRRPLLSGVHLDRGMVSKACRFLPLFVATKTWPLLPQTFTTSSASLWLSSHFRWRRFPNFELLRSPNPASSIFFKEKIIQNRFAPAKGFVWHSLSMVQTIHHSSSRDFHWRLRRLASSPFSKDPAQDPQVMRIVFLLVFLFVWGGILIKRCLSDVLFLSPYLCASFTLTFCEDSLVYTKAKIFGTFSPDSEGKQSFPLFSSYFLFVSLVWVVGTVFPCSRSLLFNECAHWTRLPNWNARGWGQGA